MLARLADIGPNSVPDPAQRPLTHVADLAEIDVAISAHVAWLDKNYADGVFLASARQEHSGRRRDPRRRHHRQDLDDRFSLDPLNKRGLAECTVVTFNPSRTEQGMERLIAQ